MSVRDPSATLECGTPVSELVAQAVDGSLPRDPEHQAGCPHCQALLASLTHSGGALTELAAEPVKVPRRLRRRVLEQIGREGDRIVVGGGPGRGIDTVESRVVHLVARQAARDCRGVDEASVRSTADPGRGLASLEVRLRVEQGFPIPELADAVRSGVLAALTVSIGLEPVTVDIHVDELV